MRAGQADIFQRIQFRQQIIRLENETNLAISPPREFVARKRIQRAALRLNFSRVRKIQSAEQMQQRAFARARRAAQREEIPAIDFQIDAAQDFQRAFAEHVGLAGVFGGEERSAHGKTP